MVNTNDGQAVYLRNSVTPAGDLLGLKGVSLLTRSDQSTVRNRGEWAFIGGIFLLQFLLFAFIALHRFIDADEGSYLLASRLILFHKKPYIDFFLQPSAPVALRLCHLDEAGGCVLEISQDFLRTVDRAAGNAGVRGCSSADTEAACGGIGRDFFRVQHFHLRVVPDSLKPIL